MILGIDVSTYLEELAHGAKFYDGEREIDPLDTFRENGVSHMRIRVWNNPFSEAGEPYLAGSCDIDHYLKLAALAKSKLETVKALEAQMMMRHYKGFLD